MFLPLVDDKIYSEKQKGSDANLSLASAFFTPFIFAVIRPSSKEKIVIISNKNVLDFYGQLKTDYDIIEIPYDKNLIQTGKVTKQAGEFSFQSLKKACEITPKAIVTAPVAKNALHLAGYIYNGQTEVIEHFLAKEKQRRD